MTGNELQRKEAHTEYGLNTLNQILKDNIAEKEILLGKYQNEIIEAQGVIVKQRVEISGLRRLLERCMTALKPENKEEI